jgi:hypothetical protein
MRRENKLPKRWGTIAMTTLNRLVPALVSLALFVCRSLVADVLQELNLAAESSERSLPERALGAGRGFPDAGDDGCVILLPSSSATRLRPGSDAWPDLLFLPRVRW